MGAAPTGAAPDNLRARLVAATDDVIEEGGYRLPQLQEARRAPLGATEPPTIEVFGRLRIPSEQAYEVVAARFRELGHIALFGRAGGTDVIRAVPGKLPEAPTLLRWPVGLFVATLLSVLYVGMRAYPKDWFDLPALLSGWPLAASLLGILLAHELGHFLVARRVGVAASLPYFIPLPLPPLGTLGAMIQLKAPPRNKRQLFAVAAAGPLCGLAVAIPVLILGLSLSRVSPIPAESLPGTYLQEGNSLLYAILKYAVFGRFLPAGGYDVSLHPVALAGWAGLLVTGMNLIPAGQLDGGHIAASILGTSAHRLSYVVVAILIALTFFWWTWGLVALLVFMFSQVRVQPLDDITPVRRRERWIGILLLAIFVLVFTPIPMTVT